MRMWIAFAVLLVSTPAFAQTSGSTSGASSAINITNPASTTATNRLITPPTVVAPGLAAAGVETCLGSSSGGVSVMGGGFSFGRTTVDDGCTIRLLARQLYAFGFQKAAVALMCQDERVATAMDAVGSPCPSAFAQPRARSQASASAVRQFATQEQAPSDLRAFAPVDERVEVYAAAVKPFTAEEKAWFDRASN
jgi:hypothetical protein